MIDAFCFVKNKEPQKNIATLFVIFIGFFVNLCLQNSVFYLLFQLFCEMLINVNSHADSSDSSGSLALEGGGACLFLVGDEQPFLAEADVEVLATRIDNYLCLAAVIIIVGKDHGSVCQALGVDKSIVAAEDGKLASHLDKTSVIIHSLILKAVSLQLRPIHIIDLVG